MRNDALKKEAELAQVLALRMHFDPHFLFNTLNAIAEWCREDALVAEKAIVQLASMLRTMMMGISAHSWPLAKELELANALFALHAVRDSTHFSVHYDIPEPAPHVGVPPMLLLPIVENAMKHGPFAGHSGEVQLRVIVDGDALSVHVSNPGAYRGPREGGDGLALVQRRLALSYGSSASFTIEREGEDRTLAVVRIPKDLTR
jgi:LytS/YehU family sensor histidine kinase